MTNLDEADGLELGLGLRRRRLGGSHPLGDRLRLDRLRRRLLGVCLLGGTQDQLERHHQAHQAWPGRGVSATDDTRAIESSFCVVLNGGFESGSTTMISFDRSFGGGLPVAPFEYLRRPWALVDRIYFVCGIVQSTKQRLGCVVIQT